MGCHDDEDIQIINEKISYLKVEASEWRAKNHHLVGDESQMNELADCAAMALVNFPPVMSVFGIPGVGKSALVKRFFYDTVLHRSSRYEDYYWLDISHPFNMKDLYLTLLSNFHSNTDPIKECHRLLNKYRCLIVINNLQSTKEWDLIQTALITKYSRSVIIVITRDASIATYCTNKDDLICSVKALEVDKATDLFKKQVLSKNPSSQFKVPDGELRELIFKCGGLAKVIAALAGLLATKTDRSVYMVSFLNRRFIHHLETNQEFDSLQYLFSWMHSFVLNPPAFLKPCIFYLSIFPQGKIIRRRRLVRRWIAEGYSRESMGMQAEEKGEMFFSELLELSIFQQVQLADTSGLNDTRVSLYQVNGFIHEYIVSMKMEDGLVLELAGNCDITIQSRGRHLIILESWDRDKIVFEKIDFSRLRSLTVFGKWDTFFISKSMHLVRVLDLENAHGVTNEDVKNMVKMLQRLKFLSLRGSREINHLPSSVGDLRQLETLDVRGTSIFTLPETITKLKKLQYVRAGTTNILVQTSTPPDSSRWFSRSCHCRVGVEVPWIGKLTALHTLGVVNVAASGGMTMVEEIRKLTQLRKLGVSNINRKNKEFFSAIKGHTHVESLSVWLEKDTKQGCCFRKDNDNKGLLDDMIALSCMKNLRSLKLYGLQNKLPNWGDGQFSKLAKLELRMDTLMQDDIMFLGKLRKLCILRIKELQDGELFFCVFVNGFEDDSYKKIKVLEISCSSSSTSLHVTFGSWTMRELELLKIDCCNGSPPYMFSGLKNLVELKEVMLVNGSNASTLKEQLKMQLADHPNLVKPVVKLEKPRRLS